MWRWLSNAADAVAQTVDDVLNAVAEAASDVVEAVGNAISDGCEWLANQAERIPGVGPGLAGVIRWVGNTVSAALNFAASVIEAGLSLLGNLLAGAIRILGGVLSLDPGLISEGLMDVVEGVLGALVMIVLAFVGLLQTVIPLQGRRRPLTAAEEALLRRVYRNALAYYNIRVVESRAAAGVFGWANSFPFVVGNTIYLKGDLSPVVLVHESMHVWQYQHTGSRYIGDAIIVGPNTNRNGGWQVELGRGRTRWRDFDAEAQAWFVEDVYTRGERTVAGAPSIAGDGAFFDADGSASVGRFIFDTTDHTLLANDAVQTIRDARNVRPSQWI